MKSLLSCALLLGLLTLSNVLTGCGGGTNVQNPPESSVGQQLLDLDEAHKKGTITDKEYERLRRKIVEAND